MVSLESIVFLDEFKPRVEPSCRFDNFFKLKDENERLKAELAECVKVYEKDREQKEVIRLLSEKILVLESQNRVYSEIIERGKKDDKRA